VSDERIKSKGHGGKWVDVFADDQARDGYLAKRGPYPVGARIVKAQHASEDATAPDGLTAMKKMPEGYDPDDGDWYYAVLGVDGNTMKSGKIEMCINCHDQVSEQDYVFGKTE
jgi:hypothetical protein